ncbi:hypothetical protein LTS15_004012 [Exophiala xenobiotica]|nr:hypothetical protein LTS15_004012 [Exophiala xenobiotica]
MTYRTDRPADDASRFIEVQLQNREALVTGTMQSFNTDKAGGSSSTSGSSRTFAEQTAGLASGEEGDEGDGQPSMSVAQGPGEGNWWHAQVVTGEATAGKLPERGTIGGGVVHVLASHIKTSSHVSV